MSQQEPIYPAEVISEEFDKFQAQEPNIFQKIAMVGTCERYPTHLRKWVLQQQREWQTFEATNDKYFEYMCNKLENHIAVHGQLPSV